MNKIISRMRAAAAESGKVVGLMAVLIVLMLWLSGAFISKIRAGAASPKGAPPQVKSQVVELREYPQMIEQVGTVQTRTQAQVASRIMAQVLEVMVREGQTVTGPGPGTNATPTALARLDGRDIEERLKQAQAQVTAAEQALSGAAAQLAAAQAQQQAAEAQRTQARADFERTQTLHAKQAATGQQLDHARAQKDVAEAQARAAAQQVTAARSDIARLQAQKEQAAAAVREAQVMLSYTTIQTPFSGRLVRKMIDAGDMVAPGQPLFVIETPGEPELHAVVADSLAAGLQPEQKLDVRIDAIRQTLPGAVREIIPQADPQTRTTLVKVSLPVQAGLISGQFGTLAVPIGKYQALVAPARAVRQVGQLHLVDVVDEQGFTHRRFVTLGPPHDEMIEVLSGLKAGQKVVIP